MPDVTLTFNEKMQELLNKALNDGLTFREGAYMLAEIQKQQAPQPPAPKQIMPAKVIK